MSRILTAALYQFVALPDCAALKAPLKQCCDQAQVKGTLLLATEGINGTIAGDEAAVRSVLQYLRADPRLQNLVHKESWATTQPFLRMKVRVKKEIVTLGVPGVSPTVMAGTYVKPQDWNALITQPNVVLIDTRNDYEVDIGTFKGAVDPRVKTFADLPGWVAEQEAHGVLKTGGQGGPRLAPPQKPVVAMFCTGGIRCEKSTAFLKMKGYQEVYHLQGGILKYLEEVPPAQSLWQGECFVFDERVSVGHGLQPGGFALCRSCRHPVGDLERASADYVQGVSCPRCVHSTTATQKQRFAERQRQVELALLHGQAHLGAKRVEPPRPTDPPHLADPLGRLLALLKKSSLQANRQRVVVAMAGLPGSGKSTSAKLLVQAVNQRLGAAQAIALGMDGFHLTKAQLAAFADPQAALTRRGAPWTFDAAALASRLQQLRATPAVTVAWPGFEHGVGDPVPNALQIDPAVRLLVVEGLYLLHRRDGWDLSGCFDETWYLDVATATAKQRLLQRHVEANGNAVEQAERRWKVNDGLNASIVRKTRAQADFLV